MKRIAKFVSVVACLLIAVPAFAQLINVDKTGRTQWYVDDAAVWMGTLPDAKLYYNSAQTPDSLTIGVSADSNQLIIMEMADLGTDAAVAKPAYPSITVMSADLSNFISIGSDGTNGVVDVGGGVVTFPDGISAPVVPTGMMSFASGAAATPAAWQVGRDADGTNQIHFNVPTGASFEFSVNDVAVALMDATDFDLAGLNVVTTGTFGAGAGTFSSLDVNGGSIVLDADGNSSITADTDDQIDFAIGGADVLSFVSSGISMSVGSAIATPTIYNFPGGAAMTLGGIGGVNDESIFLDFETIADRLTIGSASGVADIGFGNINLDTTGSIGGGAGTFAGLLTGAGVTLSSGILNADTVTPAGSATGHIIEGTLAAGETYSTTTAGLMVKEYFEDATAVVSGGEFTGLYVNVKQLAAMAGGAESSLISAHMHADSTVALDFGLRLFGNLNDGISIEGGTSLYGVDMDNQIISTAEFKMSNSETIDNVTDGTIQMSIASDTATGMELALYQLSASPTAGDSVGIVTGIGINDNSLAVDYGRMDFVIVDPADGAEVGGYAVSLQDAGGAFPASPQFVVNGGTGSASLTRESDAATGSALSLIHTSASAAANDEVGLVKFIGNNDNAPVDVIEYAAIKGIIGDETAGAEFGKIGVYAQNGTGAFPLAATIGHNGSYGYIELGDGAAAGRVSSNGDFDLIIETGNATSGTITLTDGADADITVAPNGTGNLAVSADLIGTGDILSSNAGDLGWTIQAAGNQACTTTCTNAAVFGFDTDTSAMVGPGDASADSCICAGSS